MMHFSLQRVKKKASPSQQNVNICMIHHCHQHRGGTYALSFRSIENVSVVFKTCIKEHHGMVLFTKCLACVIFTS